MRDDVGRIVQGSIIGVLLWTVLGGGVFAEPEESSESGYASFPEEINVSLKYAISNSLKKGMSPEDIARQILKENSKVLLLSEDLRDLVFVSVRDDSVKRRGNGWFIKFQQVYNQVPVTDGYELSLHLNKATDTCYISGKYFPNMSIPIEARLTSEMAVALAKDELSTNGITLYDMTGKRNNVQYLKDKYILSTTASRLIIYVNQGSPVLAYHVRLLFPDTGILNTEFLINADNGAIIRKASLIRN